MDLLGKYQTIPTTILKLEKLDLKLNKLGYSLEEHLGLILDRNTLPYDVTPCDVIPFGSIAVDGVHFGLITDFGEVRDLDDAFVVAIQPMAMQEDVIKLIARNIKEFLQVVITIKDTSLLADLLLFQTDEEWNKCFIEYGQDSDEWLKSNDFVCEQLRVTFQIDKLEDVYSYINHEVIKTRQKQLTILTADQLGIVSDEQCSETKVPQLSEISELTLESVRKFLSAASISEVFQFVRDAQYYRLLIHNEPVSYTIIQTLIELGHGDEALRLGHSLSLEI